MKKMKNEKIVFNLYYDFYNMNNKPFKLAKL
jgi:hypothetical protein